MTLLGALGVHPGEKGALAPTFVFAVSALDTVLLLGLVFLFLRLSGDSPREVFLGSRPPEVEISLGLLSVPIIFAVVVAVQLTLQAVAPGLRNVEVNPFAPLLASPGMTAAFVVLVLVAGGLREELQRAFLLTRFEQRLGGGWVGLAVTSTAFGLGHTVQGWDAAIVTGLLGALWGAAYLARRSVVGTVTSHAFFNLVQVVVGYATLSPA